MERNNKTNKPLFITKEIFDHECCIGNDYEYKFKVKYNIVTITIPKTSCFRMWSSYSKLILDIGLYNELTIKFRLKDLREVIQNE